MARRTTNEGKSMREWLAANGCAFDPLPEETTILPLQIRQAGPVESTLFRIAPRLTGFCIWLQLATERIGGVRVADFDFQLECMSDLQFALLEPPERADARWYEFPGGFAMQRTEVLNHRIPGVIHPNQPWEGFLLGTSMQQLPLHFRGHLWAQLTVWDDFRRVGQTRLRLMLEAQEHGTRRRDGKKRHDVAPTRDSAASVIGGSTQSRKDGDDQ
jgi:hypothetical protein